MLRINAITSFATVTCRAGRRRRFRLMMCGVASNPPSPRSSNARGRGGSGPNGRRRPQTLPDVTPRDARVARMGPAHAAALGRSSGGTWPSSAHRRSAGRFAAFAQRPAVPTPALSNAVRCGTRFRPYRHAPRVPAHAVSFLPSTWSLAWNHPSATGLFPEHSVRPLPSGIWVLLALCCVGRGRTSPESGWTSHNPVLAPSAGVGAWDCIMGGAIGNAIDRAVHGAVMCFARYFYAPAPDLAPSVVVGSP